MRYTQKIEGAGKTNFNSFFNGLECQNPGNTKARRSPIEGLKFILLDRNHGRKPRWEESQLRLGMAQDILGALQWS
jgi:hypothetical protein